MKYLKRNIYIYIYIYIYLTLVDPVLLCFFMVLNGLKVSMDVCLPFMWDLFIKFLKLLFHLGVLFIISIMAFTILEKRYKGCHWSGTFSKGRPTLLSIFTY